MRSDADRLGDILIAISKITERTTGRHDAFQSDEMLQVWVIHHLQVIGEAARCLSQELRDRHPEVPWPEVMALRNILVHEYFGINMPQVWKMTQRDLPKLEQQIRHVQSAMGAQPGQVD